MTHDDIETVAHQRGWAVEQCPFSGEYTFIKSGCKPVKLAPTNVAVHQLVRMLATSEKKASPDGELDRLETFTQNPQRIGATVTIYSKLAKIQSRGLHVGKSGSASIRGQRNYQYATLDDVLAAVLPALGAEGLCVVQTVVQLPDGQQGLKTAIYDESGASIESVIVLPVSDDWHAFGSGLTYAKRYGLSALVGVATDFDDDAHGALPDRMPAKTVERDHGPIIAQKRELPPASCPHCSGPMSIGPKGGSYCDPCFRARRNGYAAMTRTNV